MKHLLVTISIAILLSLIYAFKPATAIQAPSIHTPSSSNPLEGTWKLRSANWAERTSHYADDEIYKIYTRDRFAFIYYDEQEQSFSGAGGGTYTIEGNQFTETLEYFSFDQTAVGSQQTFTFEINEEGQLHQVGILQTEEYPDHEINQLYDRIESSIHAESESNPLLGVWCVQEATYGDNVNDATTIQQKYGRVYKIITPGFFYSVYFDPSRQYFNGVGFGTYEVNGGNYTETILAYSWDDASVGSQPSFQWKIKDGQFHQSGKLNAGKYLDYTIEEVFARIE